MNSKTATRLLMSATAALAVAACSAASPSEPSSESHSPTSPTVSWSVKFAALLPGVEGSTSLLGNTRVLSADASAVILQVADWGVKDLRRVALIKLNRATGAVIWTVQGDMLDPGDPSDPADFSCVPIEDKVKYLCATVEGSKDVSVRYTDFTVIDSATGSVTSASNVEGYFNGQFQVTDDGDVLLRQRDPSAVDGQLNITYEVLKVDHIAGSIMWRTPKTGSDYAAPFGRYVRTIERITDTTTGKDSVTTLLLDSVSGERQHQYVGDISGGDPSALFGSTPMGGFGRMDISGNIAWSNAAYSAVTELANVDYTAPIAVRAGDRIAWLDPTDGHELRRTPEDVPGFVFSAGDRIIISASDKQTSTVIDPATGAINCNMQDSFAGWNSNTVYTQGFSPDRRTLLSAFDLHSCQTLWSLPVSDIGIDSTGSWQQQVINDVVFVMDNTSLMVLA